MPNFQYGIAGLSQGALSPQSNITTPTEKLIFSSRVKDIILDENHPEFKVYGEWSAIGGILIEDVSQPSSTNSIAIAKPLFPNIKQYPLLNEIVVILVLTSTGLETNQTSNNLYYLPPLNIWGSQHHNAIPGFSTQSPSQQKSYSQTSAGSTKKVNDEGTTINLGKGFTEQSNINPLQPYVGDYIIEGRFGNSIRLAGFEGKDPITKIRNGQGPRTDEGWTTINEDINEDSGSLYLTSTQQVNLEPNIFNYNSYTSSLAPELVPKYSSPQVLINSGRVVLNAKEDSILLSSAKSINLNSQYSVNVDSEYSFVVNSPNVLLGDKEATEPILKGDITIELLSELVGELQKWMSQFNKNPSPYLTTMVASTTPLITTLIKVKADLETKTKSKVSKTI